MLHATQLIGFASKAKALTDGLVVYLDAGITSSYPGSGSTWYDLSGNFTNATLDNLPSWNAGGYFTFNGIGNRGYFAKTVTTDFTLSCWFRTTWAGGVGNDAWWKGGPLVDAEISGITSDFGMSFGAGKVLFGIGSPDTTIASPSTYNNGVWHNAVATRLQSTGAMKLYVDTVNVANGTGSTASRLGSSLIWMGAGYNSAVYSGDYAIARVYNKVLTQAEITQAFNADRSRFGV